MTRGAVTTSTIVMTTLAALFAFFVWASKGWVEKIDSGFDRLGKIESKVDWIVEEMKERRN